VQCADNQCQNKIAVVGLFDATGNVENPDAGSPTSVEVLEPLAFVERGDIQISAQGFCKGYHFDTSNSAQQALNAGLIGFSGYAGGDDSSSDPVATQIQCTIVDGVYQCGFGDLPDGGTPGLEPAETPLTPLEGNTGLFGNSASIGFNIAGGSDFGSFTGNQSPPYSSYPVTDDLSQVSYTAGTDATLHLDCSGDTGDCYGVVIAIIEATQNGPANFADPSPTFGYVLCGAPFGNAFGMQLGPDSLTITGDAISGMLGTDTSLQTAVTTVFEISGSAALQLAESGGNIEQMDSEGNTVLPVAGTASFGVAPLAH